MFYVEEAVTLHIVCFTCELKCFYWLVVRMQFNILLCAVKAINKEAKKKLQTSNSATTLHSSKTPSLLYCIPTEPKQIQSIIIWRKILICGSTTSVEQVTFKNRESMLKTYLFTLVFH